MEDQPQPLRGLSPESILAEAQAQLDDGMDDPYRLEIVRSGETEYLVRYFATAGERPEVALIPRP